MSLIQFTATSLHHCCEEGLATPLHFPLFVEESFALHLNSHTIVSFFSDAYNAAMDKPAHILVVEDNPQFAETLKDYLLLHEYQVSVLHDTQHINAFLQKNEVDLFILDMRLPGEDGLSLIQRLRIQHYLQPILVLSGLREDVDKIVSLEMGADDYLTKPPNFRELLARVRALLRRAEVPVMESVEPSKFAFGEFVVYLKDYRLTKKGKDLPLTKAEFDLLHIFVKHAGDVLSRDQILKLLRGYDHTPYDRSIDVTVRRLRTKIEPDPQNPTYIRTVRGVGYGFYPLQPD